MLGERKRRGENGPSRTPREREIWGMITDNYLRNYECERQWARDARLKLKGVK
jgi:hypothetical protein